MHEKSQNHVSEVRKVERKVRGPEGGSGISPECWFPTKTVAEVRCYGEQFEQPGGSELRRGREGKERRARGFIGEVLMAINLREITGGVTPASVSIPRREIRGRGTF
jgi:hypothetical protein